jgi:shikimate 5-dehydrogenase
MKKFVSISSHPGKTGTTYYNGYFSRLGLPYTYEAKGYRSINEAVNELKQIDNLHGISVSMPFKAEIIKHLDIASKDVEMHRSCNTVKVAGDVWTGYNADLAGVQYLAGLVKDGDSVAILGNGSIGKMIRYVIRRDQAAMYSRSLGNWELRTKCNASVIINATALGTINKDSPLLAIPKETRLIIDLAINPNDLAKQCRESGVDYVGGMAFYKHQFLEQFKIYTGIVPDPGMFDEIQRQGT